MSRLGTARRVIPILLTLMCLPATASDGPIMPLPPPAAPPSSSVNSPAAAPEVSTTTLDKVPDLISTVCPSPVSPRDKGSYRLNP